MHEELELMSRNVVGKLYHNHERVGPCPVEGPSVEDIVPEGEGEAALLVRQGEVQRIRNRFQLSALAREFVDVAIVSQERFEDCNGSTNVEDTLIYFVSKFIVDYAFLL